MTTLTDSEGATHNYTSELLDALGAPQRHRGGGQAHEEAAVRDQAADEEPAG